LAYINKAKNIVDEYQLGFHLDGARLFNAMVSQKVNVKQITTAFDSISICLSKGLGAPIGSVLVASSTIIVKARRIRKMLGGGMRQAGMLAAAGIYALDNHVDRLIDDHHNAQLLAHGLSAIEGITVHGCAQTNMLFLNAQRQQQLVDFLAAKNILISNGKVIRLVTHLDINSDDVAKVITAIEEFYSHNTRSNIAINQ
jgi:threonine aldolase